MVVPYSYPFSRRSSASSPKSSVGYGSRADARGVRLGDADDGLELVGREAEAGAHAAQRRVGGGDKRVGAKVEVEHGGVGALDEHPLARLVLLVDHVHGVGMKG